MAKSKKQTASAWGVFSTIPRSVKISAGMVVLMAFYIYRLPLTIMSVSIRAPTLPAAPTMDGSLSKMQHIFRKLDGAEAFSFHGTMMYTALVDGRVVGLDLSQGKFAQIETIAFTGDPQRALPFPCGKFETQPICGRPLGLAVAGDGKIVVADAYLGLLSLNPGATKTKLLSKKPDDDRLKKFVFLKDVVVGQQSGDFYFTESTSLRQLRFSMYEQFEGRSFGRLFHYSAKKKKATTMMKNLAFPTGLLLDPEEKFVLVAERAKARIIRISLASGKKKKSKIEKVLADSLPIWPERITLDADGQHFWVAGHPRHKPFALMQWLFDYPSLRSLLAKCMNPGVLEWFLPTGSLVLRLDLQTGKIVNAYSDYSGRTGVVAGVYPHGNDLYFSMYTDESVRYVGLMSRSQLGLEDVVS